MSPEYSVKITTYVNGSQLNSDNIVILDAGEFKTINTTFNASNYGKVTALESTSK